MTATVRILIGIVIQLILGFATASPLAAVLPNADTSGFSPTRLRCEYRVDPLGIDSANPRLDWILQANDSPARGLSQTAYQVLVVSHAT
jgi:alpha-L-rhamnosidase